MYVYIYKIHYCFHMCVALELFRTHVFFFNFLGWLESISETFSGLHFSIDFGNGGTSWEMCDTKGHEWTTVASCFLMFFIFFCVWK